MQQSRRPAKRGRVDEGPTPETHFEDEIYPSNSFLIPEQVPVPSRFNGEDTNYSVENFKFAVEMWLVLLSPVHSWHVGL
jgi:hypothetical protein